jgi:tRNA pseudouridine32 synthase / 23S rRNA pseudouridine746 synthase
MGYTSREMILFQNEHFLAVDKRAGWLTVPSRFGAEDPRPCEGLDWERQLGARLFPVHRLDEEVSGVLLFAKSPDSHRQANGWFEKHEVRKLYEAFTEGDKTPTDQEKFVWESLLLRGKKRAYEKPFGKKAVTEATFHGTLQEGPNFFNSWRLEPLTGRSHQLRYELSKHGWPIWGDSLYGSKIRFPIDGAIALRAVQLDFKKCEGIKRLGLPELLPAVPLKEWMTLHRGQSNI